MSWTKVTLVHGRVRGKRGLGTAGKTPVFGLPKRNGKVFVTVVPNCSEEERMFVIQGKVPVGSTMHTDDRKVCDGLILNGYNHCRVFRRENEFARGNRTSTASSASGVTPNIAS